MELYTLDNIYRRTEVIDRFESLIWTERYSAFGDFEVVVPSTPEMRKRLAEGTLLAMNESYRVMRVELTENTVDDDGKALFKARGRSLEMILEDRVAKPDLTDLTVQPEWLGSGTPSQVMNFLFDRIVRNHFLDPADAIPLLQPGSIFSPGTIPFPADTIEVRIPPMSLYQALKEIGDMYEIGFRLVRNGDQSELYFDVYNGNDRTTSQDDFPAVVFSPNLDNLKNTTELSSSASHKNCAYVFSPVGVEVVYPLDVDPEITGFERRVLLVMAEDIKDTDPAVATAAMIRKGHEELAKHRRFAAFDGELNQTSNYKYGIDYNLGDLVEMQNVDGVINKMLVTEQIFVSDAEGERSYPTLAMNLFVTPGSWLGWDYNQVWEDLGATEYWADQP